MTKVWPLSPWLPSAKLNSKYVKSHLIMRSRVGHEIPRPKPFNHRFFLYLCVGSYRKLKKKSVEIQKTLWCVCWVSSCGCAQGANRAAEEAERERRDREDRLRHGRNPGARGIPAVSGRPRGTQDGAPPTPLTPTSHTGQAAPLDS